MKSMAVGVGVVGGGAGVVGISAHTHNDYMTFAGVIYVNVHIGEQMLHKNYNNNNNNNCYTTTSTTTTY